MRVSGQTISSRSAGVALGTPPSRPCSARVVTLTIERSIRGKDVIALLLVEIGTTKGLYHTIANKAAVLALRETVSVLAATPNREPMHESAVRKNHVISRYCCGKHILQGHHGTGTSLA